MSIIGMLSYLDNIERGFGHKNDEELFKSERKDDTTGRLYEEAKKGFEFSKKYIHLGRSLRAYKRSRA
jgi:hypothetical protein